MKTLLGSEREAVSLLAELRACGLTIEADPPDHVIVRPGSLLKEELIARVRTLKPALLVLLTASRRSWPCTRCGMFKFGLPTICFWCQSAARGVHHA